MQEKNKTPKEFEEIFGYKITSLDKKSVAELRQRDKEIAELKGTISYIETTTTKNEVVMSDFVERKNDEISELKSKISLLTKQMNKKPIIVHPDILIKEITKKEEGKYRGQIIEKERIIQRIVKTLEETTHLKNKQGNEIKELKQQLEFLQTSIDLTEEIKRAGIKTSVVLEEDFETLFMAF